MRRVYLDYAAATPVDPEVLRAMEPYFTEKFGNPGSLHSFGQEAIAAVDVSREKIAKSIGADFREIIFTGSATEANNLAVFGSVAAFKMRRQLHARVIVSSVEHESVLETARSLEKWGDEVILLPVDKEGLADLDALKKNLNGNTALVSIMYANNEIGTVQPIAEISKMVKEAAPQALMHTDAVQAFQFLDCDAKKLGVDLMTLSAHKIYGPKGAGALYAGNRVQPIANSAGKRLNPIGYALSPLIAGGGQEFGMRSGTENVPAIVGFARAAELAVAARARESERIGELRDRLWAGIKKICPDAERNGGAECALPNILNVYFPGRAAQDLLTRFDLAGLAASSGSACKSRAIESSHVIRALGYPEERAKSSVRFSLGRPTVQKEIEAALAIVRNALQ